MMLEHGFALLNAELDLEIILSKMRAAQSVSDPEISFILSPTRNSERINNFISIFKTKTFCVFKMFMQCLVSSGNSQLARNLLSNFKEVIKLPESLEELVGMETLPGSSYLQTGLSLLPQLSREQSVHQYISSLPTMPYPESLVSHPSTYPDSGITSASKKSNSTFAKVIEKHRPADDSELELEEGEIVEVLEQKEDKLWKGRLSGETGLLPAKCVQIIDNQEAEAKLMQKARMMENKLLDTSQKSTGENQSSFEEKLSKITEVLEQFEIERSERELSVLFLSEQNLYIQAQDKTQPRRPVLPAARWHSLRDNLPTQKVLGLWLDTVDTGKCTTELFNFLSACSELKHFIFSNVVDSFPGNDHLIKGLTKFFRSLNKFIEVEIRETPLESGWLNIMPFMSFPHLRFLTLSENKLIGCGKPLADCLKRFPLLSWIDLGHSGLSGKEMVLVLESLSANCPLVVGLILTDNDLSHAVNVVEKLLEPSVQVLLVGRCKLKEHLFSLLSKVKESELQVLDICSHSALSNSASWESTLLAVLDKCTQLRCLGIYQSQLNVLDQVRVTAKLQKRGGTLIVESEDELRCQELQTYLNLIKHRII